ncbi:HEPN domain-containing protein [Sphingomonas sp. RB1R13]|uniref:HEPN domain-containing protein n=1 Tax=Sphingomonas sp. RB1R13 TaxID=3096159 RepID=UPI002FC89D27
MTVARPAEHGPQFEAMMAQIDFKLTQDGVDIPSRPMLALREVSLRYQLEMPLSGGDPARLPPNLRQNAALSDAIDRWYKTNYGGRLKEDPCPARIVLLLDGDLYALRVPRIFGSVNFVVTRQWLDAPGISRGPATANIVQLIDGMTPAKAARLSDAGLETIGSAFETVVLAAYTLEGTDHPLTAIALGDAGVAVEALMARGGRYGDAKWASLQVAEKVLKAAIDRAGAEPKPTHNLTALANALTSTGLVFNASAQIAAIQCSPGIRYGDEPCSRDEALAAQKAAYELINILREAGANLALSIGGLSRFEDP